MTQTLLKSSEKTVASSDGPPFRRIESDLRARLQHGEWKDGTLLPSRRALALEYGVALRTMEYNTGTPALRECVKTLAA